MTTTESNSDYVPTPLDGAWEVALNGHVLIDGIPTRQNAREIAASWNRERLKGQARFRVRRSDG